MLVMVYIMRFFVNVGSLKVSEFINFLLLFIYFGADATVVQLIWLIPEILM